MAIAEAVQPEAASPESLELLDAHVPEGSPTGSVAKGALALLSTQPLTWTISILSVLLVPRYLGDVALGQATLGAALSTIAGPVVSLGLLEYLSRALAGRSKDAPRQATQALVLMTISACVIAAIVGVVVSVVGLQLGSPAVLVAALGMIVITPTQGLLLTVLRSQERMGRYAAVSSLTAAASQLAPILVLLAGGGLAGFALSGFAVSLVSLAVAWRTSHVRLPRLRMSIPEILALLPLGFPFFGWNLTMQFYGQIDRILIGLLAPVQVVGWYAAAGRIMGIPIFVPMIIVTPLFPVLTRLRDDREAFRRTLNTTLKLTLLTTAPLCAATAAAAPAVPRFLGWPDEFDGAILPMTILAPNLTLVAVDMLLGTVLMVIGLERKWLLVGVVAAVVNPTLNVLAIPWAQAAWGNGGIGAAGVVVVTELVMMCGALLLLPRGLIDRSIVSTGLICLAASALCVLVTRVLFAQALWLPFALTPGVLAFLVVLLALGGVSTAELRQAQAFAVGLVRSRLGRPA